MLSLILILLVFGVGVTLLLAAFTFFLQGYFNETPPDLGEVLWRAPAAGAAVTTFAALWALLAYQNPERYASFLEFSAGETSEPARRLWTVRNGRLDQRDTPQGKVWEVVGGETVEYKLSRGARGKATYTNLVYGPLPSRPPVVVVEEEGEKVTFRPRRDARGNFEADPSQGLRYYDDKGRYMEEGYLGQLSVVRTGRTVVYVLLNLVHGAVWFVCAWLLLRFSLGQAIVIALVCWLTATLFVMPPILTQVRDVARERARAAQTTRGSGPKALPLCTVNSASPRYFAATVGAANCSWTVVCSPARTAIRSVRASGLPSRTTSAFSV